MAWIKGVEPKMDWIRGVQSTHQFAKTNLIKLNPLGLVDF